MVKRLSPYAKNLKYDFPSSIVVFLVALPLCLGIALASNAPLFSGIIAGVVGGIIIGALSGSQLSVSGPAAGLTAIVLAAIAKLPSFESFLLAVTLCGVFQMIFGFLKAGILGDYIPNSVIKGMLAAIGLILIIKQFSYLVGYNSNGQPAIGFEAIFSLISPLALIIGASTLAFQFGWEKFVSGKKGLLKLLPAPLLVVLIGLLISAGGSAGSWALGKEQLVNIPVANSINEFLSFLRFPDFSQIGNKEVWISAATIALVASLETLLGIEAVDDLDPYQRVTNNERELKVQGIGNMLSGLLGGLPLTSVIVRSSANVNAGARTKMSSVYHGILLLLCVAMIPAILNMIPKAALASILIFTGYKLAKPSLFKMYFKKGWDQFLPFVITIMAILLTDLLIGVVIGIVTGLFFVIRSNFKTSVVVVHDENRFLFRLRKDVSFLNKPIIKNKLEEVPEHSYVLVDTTRADFIDKDVIEVIGDFMKHAPLKNIKVELKTNLRKDQGFQSILKPNLRGTKMVNG